ncbi:MAG: hypothetical protein CVU97_00250 [Firmicutes bacterium HGW-Firmicutes-21]|nr:MAG: hypothetical protein CVU97_00250 [Firmicutes bacterium HGW-Firmicutes-21]
MRKVMKKAFVLLIVLSLILMLFGCAQKNDDSESLIKSSSVSDTLSSSQDTIGAWEKVSLGENSGGVNTLVTDKLIAYNSGSVFVSVDGRTFNKVLERDGAAFASLYAAGSKYIMTTADSRWYLWMSDNGIDYTLHTDNMGYYYGMNGITYAEGKYIGTDSSGGLYLSDDGLTWSTHKVNQLSFFLDDTLYQLVYSNGKYYGMMGSALAIASNISEWKTIKPDLPHGCTMTSLVVNGDTVLVSTYNPNNLYILEGEALIKVEDIPAGYYNKLVFSDGFYALRSNGAVYYSESGVNWNELFASPADVNQLFHSMEIFNGSIYLFDEKGTVYSRSLTD